MANLLKQVRESGFPYPDRLIHLFVGGSELHGSECEGLATKSGLPEKLDRGAISRLLSECYLGAWHHH